MRLGTQDLGPDEVESWLCVACLVRKTRSIYYLYGNNELKLYIMVGTTIWAALAKGKTVCMLFFIAFCLPLIVVS